MNKEESISEFNERLCDIANEAFSLREKFTEEKLIRKALRYLPKRFTYNVIVIEEAKDFLKIKMEEVMGFFEPSR